MDLRDTVYIDNNATTKVAPDVVEAMMPFLTDYYFNPSSLYTQAKTTRYPIEEAREVVAKFLNAQANSEIIFTGSATESNNIAFRGVLAANPERKHIITTAVEHPAIYELAKELGRFGYEITILPVNEDGMLDVKELIASIRPDTALVSIMHANNETGIIFPIDKLSRLVKMTDSKIVFHTDATQTVGKLPIKLSTELKHVDMLTFSGHKLHAPKGVGVLYNRIGTRWRPTVIGGHQEKGRRAGTENVAFIVGLAKACQLAQNYFDSDDHHIEKLRNQLEAYLTKNIPAIKINGANSPRLDSTCSVSFQGIEGESIIYALNEYKICASTGSACSSGSLAPSHVLQAMKIPFSFAHGTIRFSFGRYNSQKDLDILLSHLPKIIQSLRNISPFWDKEKNCLTDFMNE